MTTNPAKIRPISTVRIGTPALVAVVVAIATPVAVAAAVMTYPGAEHQKPMHYTEAGRIDRVVVRGGASSLHLNGSGTAGADVRETLDYHGNTVPVAVPQVVNGTLTLTYTCAPNSGGCGVDWNVTVPSGAAVDVILDSGDAMVQDITGNVSVATSVGNIAATGLGSGDADFITDTGDVTARFTGAPHSVKANTVTGNVAITTDGKTTYFDGVHTRTGSQQLTNKGSDQLTPPPGEPTIAVITETGDVTIS